MRSRIAFQSLAIGSAMYVVLPDAVMRPRYCSNPPCLSPVSIDPLSLLCHDTAPWRSARVPPLIALSLSLSRPVMPHHMPPNTILAAGIIAAALTLSW